MLVFYSKRGYPIARETLGVKYTVVRKNLRFSTEIAVYLGIGKTPMVAIERE